VNQLITDRTLLIVLHLAIELVFNALYICFTPLCWCPRFSAQDNFLDKNLSYDFAALLPSNARLILPGEVYVLLPINDPRPTALRKQW